MFEKIDIVAKQAKLAQFTTRWESIEWHVNVSREGTSVWMKMRLKERPMETG